MKQSVRGYLLAVATAGLLYAPALGQSTILDPAFGNNGRVLTTFNTSGISTDEAHSVALQPDGKIVVAGYGSNGLEVARYTAAGVLDATFGTGGQVSVEFGPLPSSTCSSCDQEPSKALAVYVQADGRIVVGGRRSSQWLVTRFLANGGLDGSIGIGGVFTVLAGTLGGGVSRIGEQTNGQVIVVGHTSSLNNSYLKVVRILANGTQDAAFTGTVPFNNSSFIGNDALVDAADRTVVLGQEQFRFSSPSVPWPQVAYRFLPGGQLDPAFGTAGRAQLPTAFDNYFSGAMAPLPSGQLLVVATNGATVRLARLQTSGAVDASFGTNGVATVATSPLQEITRAQLQPDGKLLVIGTTRPGTAVVPGSGPTSDFTLARFTAAGQLDTSYGVGGVVCVHEDNLDLLTDLSMQPDGKAVAVGYSATASQYFQLPVSSYRRQNGRFAVLRVLPTANCTMVSAGVGQSVCSGSTVPLGPAPQAGLSYSWAVSPAVSGFGSNRANTAFTAPALSAATTYTFTLTATASSGCTATNQVRLTVQPELTAQASPATIVAGQTVQLTVPNPRPGITYTWTGPGLLATTGPSVTATPTAGLSTAQYYVTGSSATGACTASALVAVAVPGTPSWVWARRAGGPSAESVRGSVTDVAGNTYITGPFSDSIDFATIRLRSQGSNDLFLAKYAADGTVLWARRYGGPSADGVAGLAMDRQGALYLTGYFGGSVAFGTTTLTTALTTRAFVARFDAGSGAAVWATADADGTGGIQTTAITSTPAGDVLVSGGYFGAVRWGGVTATGSTTGSSTGMVVRFTAAGVPVWLRPFGNGTNASIVASLASDDRGNVYVGGSVQGPFTSGGALVPTGSSAVGYLARCTPQGDIQWLRQLPGNNVAQVATDAAGNAYPLTNSSAASVTFTGATPAADRAVTRTSSQYEAYIARYDSTGNPTWARNAATCGTQALNRARVLSTQGNFLYVGGEFTGSSNFGTITLPSSSGNSAFVAKYSLSSGQNAWAQQSGLGECNVWGLGVDGLGNCYLAGDFNLYVGPVFGNESLADPSASRYQPEVFVAKLGTALISAVQPELSASGAPMQIFPNPAGSQEPWHVQFAAPTPVQELSLYSAMGQLVYRQPVTATVQVMDVPARQLPPGVYMLRLRTATGLISRQVVRY